MSVSHFKAMIADHDAGRPRGIASICSAHPRVLAATFAAGGDGPVLVEATCNQVNQDGGYTRMTPADFRRFAEGLAAEAGYAGTLILGGDHLGPNPWRHLPAEAAMDKAKAMVAAYARAGFTKIHLDASMACAGEPEALPVELIASRAAALAAVAEAEGAEAAYVIGTEVPVPGGATEHVDDLAVTTPADAAETVEAHRRAFDKAGISGAFDKIIGLVVQPGVEFGQDNVVLYDPAPARALVAARSGFGLLYEAHSTDYQAADGLAALVQDGFAILKVGPWLTFALREALYGLDHIAAELGRGAGLREGMEALMQAEPANWARYCHGDVTQQRLQRHYGYSDRVRYYWARPEAQRLVTDLLARLGPGPLPEVLVSQYLAPLWPEVSAGRLAATPDALLLAAIARILALYAAAC